jgi:hypothetical protein
MTLLLSAVAFVVGWIWNAYVMAVGGGSTVEPGTETTATAPGHSANILFWLLLFTLVAGLVSYAWGRGWRGFLGDLLSLPKHFGQAVGRSAIAAFAMLLWGIGIGLIIATVISSAVSLVLGFVLLALAATPIGVVLNFALVRVWRGLCAIVAPDAGKRLAGVVSPFMVMLGEALGLFLDWALGSWALGLLIGLAAAVLSLVIVRGHRAPRTATLLLLAVGATVVVQALRVHGAYADDGGWNECTTSDGSPCAGLGGIFAWLGSDGAGTVLAHSAIGGVGAALGALLGAGLGAAGAGLAVAASQASATARDTDRPATEDFWPADEPAHVHESDGASVDAGPTASIPEARVAPEAAAVDTSAWPGGSTTEPPADAGPPPAYSLDVQDFLPEEPERDQRDHREGDSG